MDECEGTNTLRKREKNFLTKKDLWRKNSHREEKN